MNKIYLIRHGESEMNAYQDSLGAEDKVLLGRCNWSGLSSKGVGQAKGVGNYFMKQGIKFDDISSSSAVRAQQTAQYALEQMIDRDCLHTTLNGIKISERLLERSWGNWDFQNKSHPDIIAFQKLLETDPVAFMEYRPPMGESNKDVANRVRGFIEENVLDYRQAAVFLHRGPICALLIELFDLNPSGVIGLWMGPGSVSTITYDKGWKEYETEIFTP